MNRATPDLAAAPLLTIRQEGRKLSVVAAPLAAGFLAEMGMNLTDLAIVGRLGTVSIAAVGLITAILFSVLFVCMSIASIVSVLAAAAHGAGDKAQVSNAVGQGFWISVSLSVPGTALGWYLPDLLPWLGQDPAVIEASRPYSQMLAFSILPYMLFSNLRCFAQALERTVSLLWVTVGALILNFVIVLILVHGIGDWPGLGIGGAGIGTSTVCWLAFLAQALLTGWLPSLRGYGLLRASARFDAALCGRMMRLGLPVGVMTTMEAGLFTAVQVMMGIMGPTALAANQIVMSLINFLYMIPAAVAQAAAVRVAFERGAGRMPMARQAGFVAIGMNIGYMTLVMIFMLLFPGFVVHLYLDAADPANSAVIALVGQLLFVTALFQVVDGTQVAAANALRGLEDTVVPSLMTVIGYWALGFTGGYILGFPLGFGPVGLITGLPLGLAVTAALLTWRFHRRTRHGTA
jgi:MATE family multidrug resistance protein